MGPAAKRRKRLARAAKIAALCIAILIFLNLFVVERGRVRLDSMEPSLSDGDWVLFEKTSVCRQGPKRFDIVVFKAPRDPDKVYIKRVVALPNEVVEAREGKVFVDGRPLVPPEGVDWGPLEFGPVPVEPAHYYVLGDNPAESVDSRVWDGVPRDYVLGRVFLRFYPLGEIRSFGRESAFEEGVQDGDQGIQADG